MEQPLVSVAVVLLRVVVLVFVLVFVLVIVCVLAFAVVLVFAVVAVLAVMALAPRPVEYPSSETLARVFPEGVASLSVVDNVGCTRRRRS